MEFDVGRRMPLATDASVLTPAGYKNVESIAVGDDVVTPLGIAKVLTNGLNNNYFTPFVTVGGLKITGSIRLLTPDLSWSVVTARSLAGRFQKIGLQVEYLFAEDETDESAEASHVFSFDGPVEVVRPGAEDQQPIVTRRLITDNGLYIVNGFVAFGFLNPPIDLSLIPKISQAQLDTIKSTYL